MIVNELTSQDDLDATTSVKDDNSPITSIKFKRLYLLEKESSEWHVFKSSEVLIK